MGLSQCPLTFLCVLWKTRQVGSSIVNPGTNIRKHFVGSRRPPASSSSNAYDKVCELAENSKGRQTEALGQYRRTTLSLDEAQMVLRCLHSKLVLRSRLLELGVRLLERGAIHAYYTCKASGGAGESGVGWHSDPHAGVLVHLCGTKQLEIGGIHVVCDGSVGETTPISRALSGGPHVACVSLLPNTIVGFAKRQVHRLRCSQQPNLSLSFPVYPIN